MSQSVWRPPNIDRYTGQPTQCYRAFSPKQKVLIWLLAVVLSWFMGLGVVKLSLILYDVLGQVI